MRHLLLILSLFAVAMPAQIQTIAIRPSPENRMQLLVTKTGFLRGKQHLFLFERYDGSIRYDTRKPEASQVSFSIESSSISCKDTWVSVNDLRKIQEMALKDMLDAEHHPRIVFVSTAIKEVGPGKFDIQGQLTIRGIAKPITAVVSMTTAAGGGLSFEGRSQVRLTDYNLKPPSAALGTIGTKDEMSFSFLLAGKPAN
jgi:polyisoprenoid-binding protein YceI